MTQVKTMLNSSASLWLGITFVLVGAFNVWLILQASPRVRHPKPNPRLVAAQRVRGYRCIGVFCVIVYFMAARLGDGGSASSGAMIHMTLAMVLSPLLSVKVM